MDKYMIDERTVLKYKLVSDYYFIAGDEEQEEREHHPIGIWGQWYLRYIKQHKWVFYANMLISNKLNSYLADLNDEAE